MENIARQFENYISKVLNNPFIFRFILFLIFIFSLYFAYLNKFIQDDAFITFRYSENWFNGLGPIFNEGEKVEGYTNFLWMLIISGSFNFYHDPVIITYCWGLLLFTLTLFCFFLVARTFLEDNILIILFLLSIGSNYSFSSYATGGLETSLASSLIALTFLIFYRIENSKIKPLNLIVLSFILALLILTRLDLGIVVMTIYAFMIYKIFFIQKYNKFVHFVYLSLPLALVASLYLYWKYNYYGNILPNTFNAKLNGGSDNNILSGFDYLFSFISTYWLGFPIILVLLFFLLKKLKIKTQIEIIGISILLLVTVYIVKIGGDFMEFRFFIPYLPLFFLFLFKYFHSLLGRVGTLVLIVSVTAASLDYRFKDKRKLIKNFGFSGIETISNLQSHLYDPLKNWVLIGKKLNEFFENKKIQIAVGPAGAIPFYSKMYTLDMLGLNDENVKNAEYFDTFSAFKSGHKKYSRISYLLEKRIELVIANPIVYPSQKLYKENPMMASLIETQIDVNLENKFSIIRAFFPLIDREEMNKLNEIKFLWLPLDENTRLLVLYLSQSVEVDNTIRQNKWETFSIKFEKSNKESEI